MSKKPVNSADRCTHEQRKFLLGALGKIVRNRWEWKQRPLPKRLAMYKKRIARLQKAINKFENIENAKSERRMKAWENKLYVARNLIFFSTAEKAQKAVEDLKTEYQIQG